MLSTSNSTMLQNSIRNRVVKSELSSSFQFDFSFNFKIVSAGHKKIPKRKKLIKLKLSIFKAIAQEK